MDMTPAPAHHPSKRLRLLGSVTGVVLVLGVIGGYGVVRHLVAGHEATATAGPSAAAVPKLVSAASLEQRRGVRITQVAMSGGGGLVDVRYQVVDPDKAVALHESPPELVDETTGVVVDQLFMGHSHQGPLHAGQTYFLLFENPGTLVEAGTRVTVVLGGLRVAHVAVE